MDNYIKKYNTTTGKRQYPFPPYSNICYKKSKTTQADAERYEQPPLEVFFCDNEKDNIPGIIRDVCPLAKLTDISQGSEMFSEVEVSSPSFLYLSPNIKSRVLNLVRNLVPVLPEKKARVFMHTSENRRQEETMSLYSRPGLRKSTRDLNPFQNLRGISSFVPEQKKIEAMSKGNLDTLLSQVTEESVVGIFSRSAESNYRWLKGLLEPRVKHVKSNYISSNMKFMEAIWQCNFGILYHTSTSGRINIANVTDSLYDEELKYMSEKLDKKNVLVVVDDLTNNSNQEKRKILQSQPSISQYATDLILISKTEKRAIVT